MLLNIIFERRKNIKFMGDKLYEFIKQKIRKHMNDNNFKIIALRLDMSYAVDELFLDKYTVTIDNKKYRFYCNVFTIMKTYIQCLNMLNVLITNNYIKVFPKKYDSALGKIFWCSPLGNRILKKLNQLKKEIEEGSSFKMKAIINSNDPGVTNNGGRYTIDKNSTFIKEFKETAFSLDVNQVSEPIKSQFGYHIIQLHEIRGETRIASHILLQPEIPQEKLEKTKELLVKIVAQIKSGEVTFEEAVRRYSQDTDTRNNGGLIVNPYSGESTFDLTRMDPALYARVNNIQKNEMSDVFYDEDRSGKKMYKVMIMKDRTNTHEADMVDDYVKVQNLALQKKKQETIAKWSKEKIGDTYIKISSEYQKCNFDKNWTKEISN